MTSHVCECGHFKTTHSESADGSPELGQCGVWNHGCECKEYREQRAPYWVLKVRGASNWYWSGPEPGWESIGNRDEAIPFFSKKEAFDRRSEMAMVERWAVVRVTIRSKRGTS